ncbi:MAG TPA: glutathione S-transferase family protein [Polyangiaceae bacterium]|nr:glutathione S-transferase family protein [Polyangiaceae bacterium]
MKLYDFAFSPNCRKVRAVAYELGLPFEPAHVDLLRGEQKAPAFLSRNPNGRVPVLVDGDLVLWESMAILRYFSAKKGGALLPSTARGQAEVDRWLSWQLAHLGPAMSKVSFERVVKRLTNQGEPDQAAIAAGSAEFAKLTGLLDAALEGREYLAGELTLADFALAAHYSLAGVAGLDMTPFPRVNAWLARVLGRESMRRALAEAQATLRPNAA